VFGVARRVGIEASRKVEIAVLLVPGAHAVSRQRLRVDELAVALERRGEVLHELDVGLDLVGRLLVHRSR